MSITIQLRSKMMDNLQLQLYVASYIPLNLFQCPYIIEIPNNTGVANQVVLVEVLVQCRVCEASSSVASQLTTSYMAPKISNPHYQSRKPDRFPWGGGAYQLDIIINKRHPEESGLVYETT